MKLIQRGAEALLYKDKYLGIDVIRKIRTEKPYKDKTLDERLRAFRTRNEARLLNRARCAVNTPHVIEVIKNRNEIVMEFIDGERIKERFFRGELRGAKKIGEHIKKMHDHNIIHNDLTTSNMIMSQHTIYFIDFGLGFISPSIEDKATDLVVLKKMLQSTHFDHFSRVWGKIIRGYKPSKAIEQKIADIESRVRYK
ncbi:MAG: Kae1-associated serine/threonine protein kinase [Candidatus Diapherotrites archaeon]|nr:Kae1-associated serine/threonine protein kinase [Candidatus Diapherotrites archaeon]